LPVVAVLVASTSVGSIDDKSEQRNQPREPEAESPFFPVGSRVVANTVCLPSRSVIVVSGRRLLEVAVTKIRR
jgi:hypothetical protein